MPPRELAHARGLEEPSAQMPVHRSTQLVAVLLAPAAAGEAAGSLFSRQPSERTLGRDEAVDTQAR